MHSIDPLTYYNTSQATMVYIMYFKVDGACRGNGKPWARGAAAALRMFRGKGYKSWTRLLPSKSDGRRATNQRAELLAIVLALEKALERYEELNGCPRVDVKIHSDSKYAVNCMNKWVYKWVRNGWRNSRGLEICNRDLIERASELDDELAELGNVKYIWISREQNIEADQRCNACLDEVEE